jgi:hypothetical protein
MGIQHYICINIAPWQELHPITLNRKPNEVHNKKQTPLIHITEASPVDLADYKQNRRSLFCKQGECPAAMYDGMVVYLVIPKNAYLLESQQAPWQLDYRVPEW